MDGVVGLGGVVGVIRETGSERSQVGNAEHEPSSRRGGAANFLLGGPSSNLKEAFFVWNSYIYHRGVASFFSEGEGQKIISQFIFG